MAWESREDIDSRGEEVAELGVAGMGVPVRSVSDSSSGLRALVVMSDGAMFVEMSWSSENSIASIWLSLSPQ